VSERYETGMANRRSTLGAEYVAAAVATSPAVGGDFQQLLTEYCWGGAWAAGTLEPKHRSLVTVAILATLGRLEELQLHTRGALRNGATADELTAVVTHVAIYAGVPAGLQALRIANVIVDSSTD